MFLVFLRNWNCKFADEVLCAILTRRNNVISSAMSVYQQFELWSILFIFIRNKPTFSISCNEIPSSTLSLMLTKVSCITCYRNRCDITSIDHNQKGLSLQSLPYFASTATVTKTWTQAITSFAPTKLMSKEPMKSTERKTTDDFIYAFYCHHLLWPAMPYSFSHLIV